MAYTIELSTGLGNGHIVVTGDDRNNERPVNTSFPIANTVIESLPGSSAVTFYVPNSPQQRSFDGADIDVGSLPGSPAADDGPAIANAIRELT